MIHLITKSHRVLFHLPVLTRMQHMVQLEFSIMDDSDAFMRSFEFFTPSIQKRLDTIRTLSDAGIFVRTMAIPFVGDRHDANVLRDLTFAHGARAFKERGLNYFDWPEF
ncbi:MAG: hypothetical protein IPP94_16690 [Ignavibacteria bacterium]|nr:hypothetical protein [Ignavibacteria bacterium]